MLLNQTTRKQLDKVIDEFFSRWPDAESLLSASPEEIGEIIKPLGFWRRRPKALQKFSREYVENKWKEPDTLYGIGKYAHDAWRIFIKGDWKEVDPNDHALNKYHAWLRETHEVH